MVGLQFLEAPTLVIPLFVGTVGVEPTWNQLTFQPRIRRRVYVPYFFVGPGGLEPLPLGRDLQSRCRIRTTFSSLIICVPDRVRTCDPLIKSEVL